MADDPSLIPGDSRSIATEGVSTGASIAISTQGFIIPILGDIILGGRAVISYTPGVYVGSGGIIISGEAGVISSVTPPTNIIISGSAGILSTSTTIGSGGLILGGEGIVSGPSIKFGRGGAARPNINRPTFELPTFAKDDFLTPMDYLKRIQQKIKDTDKARIQNFKYKSNGSIKLSGNNKLVVVLHDLPSSEIIIADNPPLTPIELNLPNVFSSGTTAIEIAELEDHLFLNDLLNLGDYKITTGPKVRFVHEKKTTGGTATVKFTSSSSITSHFDMGKHRQQIEDDEFVLELNMRSRQDQEEEELHMLGLIE